MDESRNAAGQLKVTAPRGFRPETDALARRSLAQPGRLQRARHPGGANRVGAGESSRGSKTAHASEPAKGTRAHG
ncbi:hypothetical protein [Erythrobacter tepidarius]|uniref:hypothetical protein n=1 Tax=Erythrobacter tepidarius TaxID=60454 RepID=UPI000A3667BD|nr:hypothetical protein [Erythrobacter tepidarius]